MSKTIYQKAYIAWFSISIFYLYQYLLRIFPNIMVNEIRDDFGMTAVQYGFLGSATMYAYSLIQIPLGGVVDRIGVKKTVLTSLILCIIGSYSIALTKIHEIAYIGRFIVGVGAASALMSALKIVSDYLPHGKRGFLIGATLSIGMIGTVFAVKPILYLTNNYGWRGAVIILSFIGSIIFLLCLILISKDFKPLHIDDDNKSFLKRLKKMLFNKNTLFYGFVASGLYAPLSVVADLWGTEFLVNKYFLDKETAASFSTLMYLGMGIGSLFFPWFAEKKNIIDEAINYCLLGLLITFGILLYGPVFNKYILMILLVAVGLFCGAEMICFTGALVTTSSSNSGLTIGIVNTLNMFFAAISGHLVGCLLDLFWHGAVNETGNRIYNASEYVNALSFLFIFVLVCTITGFVRNYRKK